jgi:hypothetical protein
VKKKKAKNISLVDVVYTAAAVAGAEFTKAALLQRTDQAGEAEKKALDLFSCVARIVVESVDMMEYFDKHGLLTPEDREWQYLWERDLLSQDAREDSGC